MTQLILNVNDTDLSIIEPLLNRLKIAYATKEGQKKQLVESNTSFLKELNQLAEKITISSFGDPVEWQKEVRQDRQLAFREE